MSWNMWPYSLRRDAMVFARVALCWGILHLIILASYSADYLLPIPDSENTDLFRNGPLDVTNRNGAHLLRDERNRKHNTLQRFSSERHLQDPSGEQINFDTITVGAPICNKIDPNQISFTLVTQLSDERLWMMRHHCAGWNSDVSLAVFTDRKKDAVEKELHGLGCSNFKVNLLPKHDFKSGDYPVNILRNLAISSVKTSHFLYIDADFWLSHHTDKILMKRDVRRVLSGDPQQAIVLPAYQLRFKCMTKGDPTACRNEKIPLMPRTKLQLLEGMNDGNVTVFDPKNPHGAWIEFIPLFSSDVSRRPYSLSLSF